MLSRILLMAFVNHCSKCAEVSKFKHKNGQLKIHLRTGVIDIIIASLTAGMTSSVKPLQMWCFLPKKYWETEHGFNSLSIKKCGLVALPSAALAILIATARAIFRRVKMPAHGLIHGPNDGVTARSIARSEELDVLDEGVVEQRELDAKLDLLRPLVP